MKKPCHYLIIDDDTTNNLICQFTIRRYEKEAEITMFTSPEMALDFMENKIFDQGCENIVFLDINMPTMTGFEFLREFEKFGVEIKEQYRIYILTSSIEDFSLKSINFPRVKGFLSKPLQISYLEEICKERLLESTVH